MLRIVLDYLNKRSWSYSDKNDGSIYLSLKDENGTYHCIIYCKEESKIFAFISFLGIHCPADKLHDMIELVNEVNNTLLYGNFEINSEGDIKHRTSIYLENSQITEEIIEAVIMQNITNINFANPILLKTMFGNMGSKEAYESLFPQLKEGVKELGEGNNLE